MIVFPGTGALALVWMIGAYAFVLGVLWGGLGFRLHRLARGRPREL